MIRRLLAIPPGILFVLSLIVHTAAWMGVDVERQFPFVWGLHIGIFVMIVPMMIAMEITSVDDKARLRGSRSGITSFVTGMAKRPVPDFVNVMFGGFFYYIVVNFMLNWLMGFFGIGDGMSSPGFAMRMFSGHWMFFYLLPTLYFWYSVPEDQGKDKRKSKPKRD